MCIFLIFINDTLSDIKGEFDVVIDIVVHTNCGRISLINIISRLTKFIGKVWQCSPEHIRTASLNSLRSFAFNQWS